MNNLSYHNCKNELEDLYMAGFLCSPIPAYIKSIDGVYLTCNKKYIDLLGLLQQNEIIGKTDFDLPWLIKKEIDSIAENESRCITEDNEITFQESITFPIPGKKIYLSKKTPLKDNFGFIKGIMCFLVDITEFKSQETNLKLDKEKAEITLENIISRMPGHVYWKDKDGVYLGCNDSQAKSLGLNSGMDVIGKTDFDLPWGDDLAKHFRQNDIDVMSFGIEKFVEEESQVKGKKATVLSQKVALKSKKGEVIGVLGISLDITELKQTQNELIKAKELTENAIDSKLEFLKIISHELRSKFNNISGANEVIGIKETDLDTKKEYHKIINDSVFESISLLENVLYLFEIDKNGFSTKKHSINVEHFFESLLSNIRVNDKVVKKLEIFDSVPKAISIDAINFGKTVDIVLKNSARFTDSGEIILRVNASKSGIDNNLIVEITDTGVGISSIQKQNIFNTLLTSNENDAKTRFRKPGVKLPIAKKILEILGGTLTIKESQLNIGTTMKLTVPFTKSLGEFPRKTKEFSRQIETLSPAVSLNILLVEDDAISSKLQSDFLLKLGHKVTRVSTGLHAVEAAISQKFDLIMLDITLPDIDGVEVVRRIHEQVDSNSLDIVAVTSHSLENDYFIENGFMTTIGKPISQEKFERFFIDYFKIINERSLNQDD